MFAGRDFRRKAERSDGHGVTEISRRTDRRPRLDLSRVLQEIRSGLCRRPTRHSDRHRRTRHKERQRRRNRFRMQSLRPPLPPARRGRLRSGSLQGPEVDLRDNLERRQRRAFRSQRRRIRVRNDLLLVGRRQRGGRRDDGARKDLSVDAASPSDQRSQRRAVGPHDRGCLSMVNETFYASVNENC